MRHTVAFGAAGWLSQWMRADGPPRPQVEDEHPVDSQTYEMTREHKVARFMDGALGVPHDDREAWKRLRQIGRDGAGARETLRRLTACRAAGFPDAGGVAGEVPHGSLYAGAAETFPEVEGLVLRPFGAADFDVLAPLLTTSGIYPAVCPGPPTCDCTPPEAHAWLALAARTATGTSHQFCLAFNGAPLQYEIIDVQGHRATFELTAHANRERPAWFWREASRPVFQLLRRAGTILLQSRTRSDRPDWIQALKENYGAATIEATEAFTVLDFPLDLGRFTGWPERTTVGHDVTDGRVRQWEATAADLPALKTWIASAVPPPRTSTALRMVDEWWHLDRATILLGSRDGDLRYARGMRYRKAGNVSSATFGPAFDEPEIDVLLQHTRLWCQRAAYQTFTTYVPGSIQNNPRVVGRIARAGLQVKRVRTDFTTGETFTELEMNV